MDSKILLKTVRLALQKASGKPIDEAAQVVCEYISLAEGLIEDIPMPIATLSERGLPQLAYEVSSTKELPTLAPVKEEPIVRNFRTSQELMLEIEKNMPPYLDTDVTRDGKPLRVHMIRSVIATTAQDCFGAQVCYLAEGQSQKNPYPKITMWVTDEKLDFSAAQKDLLEQAQKIYGFVPKATTSSRPPAPSQIRFANTLEEA